MQVPSTGGKWFRMNKRIQIQIQEMKKEENLTNSPHIQGIEDPKTFKGICSKIDML